MEIEREPEDLSTSTHSSLESNYDPTLYSATQIKSHSPPLAITNNPVMIL